jgi:hypothetical protein
MNVHRRGPKPDILLFATARGGSTWLMEVIASQPGIKYYDEPLSPRRDYASAVGLKSWEQLMPDTGDPEWIVDFLRALQKGKFGLLNPTPFARYHRFFTDRIVFKIHEIEHLMAYAAERCGAKIIYLVRHPIANSISRHVLPRLELFLQSQRYAQLFDDETKLHEVRALGRDGSHFQKAIVSWCFENVDALRFKTFDGLVVTYEELVLNPERACDLLTSYFDFSDKPAMLRAFETPAENIGMSNQNTIAVMQQQKMGARRYGLVTKWQKEVSPQQIDQASRILTLFEIDAYDPAATLSTDRFLLFPDTRTLFDGYAPDAAGN